MCFFVGQLLELQNTSFWESKTSFHPPGNKTLKSTSWKPKGTFVTLCSVRNVGRVGVPTTPKVRRLLIYPSFWQPQRWEDSPFPDDLPIFQWRFSAKHVDYIYLAGPEGNLKWETSVRCIVFTRNDWGFTLQCQMTTSFTLQCQMISRLYRNIGTATVMSSIVLVTGNAAGVAFPTYGIVWLLDSVWCLVDLSSKRGNKKKGLLANLVLSFPGISGNWDGEIQLMEEVLHHPGMFFFFFLKPCK